MAIFLCGETSNIKSTAPAHPYSIIDAYAKELDHDIKCHVCISMADRNSYCHTGTKRSAGWPFA